MLDHVLDLLAVIAEAGEGETGWFRVGVALLAARGAPRSMVNGVIWLPLSLQIA